MSNAMQSGYATGSYPQLRMRRLRQHGVLRDLVAEHQLRRSQLIFPLFVQAGVNIQRPIASLPGHFQWSVDQLPQVLDQVVAAGIDSVLLFGLPAYKDARGSAALDEAGVIQSAVAMIKAQYPGLLVIADLCFCEYTDHGHCGVLAVASDGCATLDNDATLTVLGEQAVSLAKAGADVIAPSGMLDGMVQAIRSALDAGGCCHTPILSYAVKYHSALYAPFREAAQGAPSGFGREGYQMNPANAAMALREAALDRQEGADMLMVKPAGWYGDILSRVAEANPGVPLFGYQVSGEYAMIKAAAQQGWLEEEAVMLESLLAIHRAGAQGIVTYYALEAAACLS